MLPTNLAELNLQGINKEEGNYPMSAEETCEGNPVGIECAVAWDEVEELSAAASHACNRKKDNDSLEEYCKDNPETDECRTYED
ncbi:hypothetical protein GUJ93_ZPchr0002g23609 [Zizania palustris]|uniref:CP12 domain-containing protein n=1 Tax=Zizania palustris TaxID=103762 RepID=A0A8J5VE83_ZIZPA|nr:hypothetical protein GUJ93_ZPchr0002g23609 [Zizania palustris]